nr:hypothetical protein [Brevibacillus sp. WF146]
MNSIRKREIASTVFRKIDDGKFIVVKNRNGELFKSPATYTERFVRAYAAIEDDVVIESTNGPDGAPVNA